MTPLEKAARAVEAVIDGPDLGQTLGEEIARAVLMAVREPSKPLWLAGMSATNGHRNEITPQTVSAAFTGIIDAILAEEQI